LADNKIAKTPDTLDSPDKIGPSTHDSVRGVNPVKGSAYFSIGEGAAIG
jgi:hypothetical protein